MQLRITCTSFAFWLAAVGTTLAQTGTVVVPNANANLPGGSENSFPFNISPFSLTEMRYQQVYHASQFAALHGGGLILSIAFRPSVFTGSAFSAILPSVDIWLSTAPSGVGPGSLSSSFAANIGADATLVFSGALPLSSANTGSPARDFDIVINLTTPFFYDPQLGNLLLEVFNYQGGTTTPFDAVTIVGSMVSRLYAPSASASSGSVDSTGLITQFTFVAIPEPTSVALLGAGLAGAADSLRRRVLKHRRHRHAFISQSPNQVRRVQTNSVAIGSNLRSQVGSRHRRGLRVWRRYRVS
jgi:hypothetical protein